MLLLDGGEKRLKIAQSQNEERQVEENIMHLRVSQLERMTSNVSDKVYDLEKYRLHLEAVSHFLSYFVRMTKINKNISLINKPEDSVV